MLLLGRCHGLIRNRSMFSLYALVMTYNFGGNVVDLESLFPSVRDRLRGRLTTYRGFR
jgi:hypothetical protein